MRLFWIFLSVLIVGCGVSSTERFESASTCRLENAIELGGATLSATPLIFTDTLFHATPSSKSADIAPDQTVSLRLYLLQVGDAVQTDMVGGDLQPDRTAGIAPTFTASQADEKTDEEGFRHLYPLKRNLGGKIKVDAGVTTYTTVLAERPVINDQLAEVAEGNMLTSLRVILEGSKLLGVEFNWPVTNDKNFRAGDLLLPRLDKWQDSKNESACVKSATLSR